MLDLNFIREQPDVLRTALADRQMDSDVVETLLLLDTKRRALLVKVESLKAQRNTVSKEISQTKDADQKQEKILAMRTVGDEIAALDEKTRQVDEKLTSLLANILTFPTHQPPLARTRTRMLFCAQWENYPNLTLPHCLTGSSDQRSGSSILTAASSLPALVFIS